MMRGAKLNGDGGMVIHVADEKQFNKAMAKRGRYQEKPAIQKTVHTLRPNLV